MSDERPIRQFETEEGPKAPLPSPEERALRVATEKASRAHDPWDREPAEDLPKPEPANKDDQAG